MNGQVVVITGAAGGIGTAISRQLAASGARIVLVDLAEHEKIEAVKATLDGNDHMVARVSITDSSQLAGLAGDIEQRYGRLDVLVNNAGITRPVDHADLDGLDDELIDRIMQVNFRGAFACVRAFKSLLMAGNGGTVVNISSIAARTGVGSNVAYCASKAAIESMTRSLARALAPKIRMVAIAPGWVLGEYARRMDPAYLQQQTDLTPLGRLATPEDVARTVWVAITQLTFTTGVSIPVDGGRPLR